VASPSKALLLLLLRSIVAEHVVRWPRAIFFVKKPLTSQISICIRWFPFLASSSSHDFDIPEFYLHFSVISQNFLRVVPFHTWFSHECCADFPVQEPQFATAASLLAIAWALEFGGI
jgi:hypothetical protein